MVRKAPIKSKPAEQKPKRKLKKRKPFRLNDPRILNNDEVRTGRPPIYHPVDTPALTNRLCLLGCTDVRLAELLGISIDTLYLWQREHEPFLKAIREGREEADANVAKSTYNRAKGYEVEEKHFRRIIKKDSAGKDVLDDDGNIQYEMVCDSINVRHVPADPALNKFWLWNRTKSRKDSSEKWNEAQSIEVTGKDGKDLPTGGNCIIILPAKQEPTE